uniref:Uncharacterized protein n=1 Tax=Rodentolepis nana TaxID=102285 RepID=A0A0R3T2M1_RODNA
MGFKKILASLFTYETPKIIEIYNYKIGIAHRILQTIIIIYFGKKLYIITSSWVVIYDKGYQVTESLISVCLTKVKGFLVKDYKQDRNYLPQIWDNAEIVYPPLEQGAILIITNTIETLRQTPCIGKPIYSWCPLENDTISTDFNLQKRFEMISNYTIYIKLFIEYRRFGIKGNNIFDDIDITTCQFDKKDPINRHCPIFKLGYIFEEINLKPPALYKNY